jgi:hypothetical protein
VGDETGGLRAGLAGLSSSDLVDRVYRRIVETNTKHYGWQVCFCSCSCFCFCFLYSQILYYKFIEFNT